MVGMGLPASCGGWNSSPGVLGMSRIEIRSCLRGASGLVTTVVHNRCALFAQVHQVFSPLITYLSPLFTARHLIPAESLPASGSVKAAAARISPVQSPGRNFCFCSSEPLACTSDAVMIIRVITEPTDSQALDSSSATMAIERVSSPLPPYWGEKISPK